MGDFFNFTDHPGHVFVVATFIPLASFVLILLFNGVRSWLRKSYHPDDDGVAANIYRALGGDKQTKLGACVATGAIFLSFCFCAYGFGQFLVDHQFLHVAEGQNSKEMKAWGMPAGYTATQAEHFIHHRWEGHITWANLTLFEQPGVHKHDDHGDHDDHKHEKLDTSKLPPVLLKHGTQLQLGYRIDSLSAVMFVMVTFIATLIHLFSIGYMGEELTEKVEDHEVHTASGHLERRSRFTRFFSFLSLFCFSMLNLILADNLFQIFVSWELVGICSYLLIGFYYERQSASNAANKAFITNRVGDAGFIIGLLIVWTYVGTFNFQEIFARVRAPEVDTHHKDIAKETAGQFIRVEKEIHEDHFHVHPKPDDGEYVLLLPTHFHRNARPLWNHQVAIQVAANDAAKKQGLDPPYGNARIAYNGEQPENVEPSEMRSTNNYNIMPYWMLVVAGLGIFLGCVGKSAQFPLQVWLPDAMEGPTPVSALIHAATMVAAGVYLVGRCYPLFTPEVLLTIAYVGGITLFVAASIAVVMTDIKKVLAYSTVSQLGYMMLALGIGGWAAGLLHLVTHAFFKALLFLGSGSVIYGCHHVQEMGKMGGLLPKMRITALTMLVGVFAIMGVPLFSGWYSKDAILAQGLGYVIVHPEHFLLFLLPLVTAGITTFYMLRMWFLTFTGKPKDDHVHEHAHESPWVMTVPLILLAVFSVCVAWGWPLWRAEASWLEHELHHSQPAAVMAEFGTVTGVDHPSNVLYKDDAVSERHLAHTYHDLAGLLALLSVVVGLGFALSIYVYKLFDAEDVKARVLAIHDFLAKKWYFDELYSAMLIRPITVVATWCRWFDTNVIDGVIHFLARALLFFVNIGGLIDKYIVDGLVNVLGSVCQWCGARLRGVQTGFLRSYVLFLVLAAVGLWVVLALMMQAAVGAN